MAWKIRCGLPPANLKRIGRDFRNIPTTRAAMAMTMAALDLGHQICPFTCSEDMLTVDEGVCRWRFKNREIGDALASGSGTSRDMAKWMAAFDSAHQICVSTVSKEVLTVD